MRSQLHGLGARAAALPPWWRTQKDRGYSCTRQSHFYTTLVYSYSPQFPTRDAALAPRQSERSQAGGRGLEALLETAGGGSGFGRPGGAWWWLPEGGAAVAGFPRRGVAAAGRASEGGVTGRGHEQEMHHFAQRDGRRPASPERNRSSAFGGRRCTVGGVGEDCEGGR